MPSGKKVGVYFVFHQMDENKQKTQCFFVKIKFPTARTKHKPDNINNFLLLLEKVLLYGMTHFTFVTKQRSFALNHFKSPPHPLFVAELAVIFNSQEGASN